MTDTTGLLLDAQAGDAEAREELFQHVYDELRQIAHRELSRRSPGATLQTTALVNEAYLKLFDQDRLRVQDRTHFLALSSRAMRHIIVDYFRRGSAVKRGGDRVIVPLEAGTIAVEDRGEVVQAVDAALSKLERLDDRLARVVEYRFFGGMTQPEIATALGLTDRTVRSDWRKARAWLARELLEFA